MNLTQQSNSHTSHASQQSASRQLVNKEAALWKGIAIQFKDACRLELLGNKDEAQLWLKNKVSPFINLWSKEAKLSADEKKTRLRILLAAIRKEAELELKKESVNKPLKSTAQTPFRHPEVARPAPVKAETPTSRTKSPYLASYAQHSKGRVSKPRLPISDISSMIDAVQDDSETSGAR